MRIDDRPLVVSISMFGMGVPQEALDKIELHTPRTVMSKVDALSILAVVPEDTRIMLNRTPEERARYDLGYGAVNLRRMVSDDRVIPFVETHLMEHPMNGLHFLTPAYYSHYMSQQVS